MKQRRRRKFANILQRLQNERPDVNDPGGLLAAGAIWVGGVRVQNPRTLVPTDAPLVVAPERELRGTRKLRAALSQFALPVEGRIAVDLGASTGGFTTALLAGGAARVYAVDAGYGQLLGRLRCHPRVVNLERTNLGALDRSLVTEPIDLITMDLSYLSIARAAGQLRRLALAPGADVIALVKPMYELARASPPTDEAELSEAVERAARGLCAHGFRELGRMRSPIPGARGAIEFFLHARRTDG